MLGLLAAIPRFLFLSAIKVTSHIFFRFEVEWVGRRPKHPFRDAHVGLLLNHTSLFEPIFFAILPYSWLWDLSCRGLLPGADSTLDRPIAGRFFKYLVPQTVSVTRNRDKTWRDFVSRVDNHTIILMSPEGRMKRRNGLDKHGRPMTMRGGIADVLERKQHGTLLLLYSGGLHHVQAPGEGWPRLFQTVQARLEEVPIEAYKAKHGYGTADFRTKIMADLGHRRDLHCRWPR